MPDRRIRMETGNSGMSRSVEYSLLETRFPKEYGIIARQKQPQYFAVTMPFTKDLHRLQRVIQRFNREQTPVEEFKEIYLSGNILEHL